MALRRSDSHHSYPTFLSLSDTATIQLQAFLKGLQDAFRWDTVYSAVSRDVELRAHVLKSVTLNALSLVSIYMFDFVLLPLVAGRERWWHLSWVYQVLWLAPVVGVSYYLNSTWSTVIAKRTYTISHGSRAAQQDRTYTGLLRAVAVSAYRAIMVVTSLVVTVGLGLIPFIGPPLAFIFMCWVDSYYFFEYVWIAKGKPLARRIEQVEERWAYYLGFGLPATVLCTWGSSLANVAVFALVFPAFIIMAMSGTPLPLDPYSPAPSTSDAATKHPSPFIPIRLPIFKLVILINDAVVRVLSVGGGRHIPGHSRAMSDGFENAEQGQRPSFGRNMRTVGRRKVD